MTTKLKRDCTAAIKRWCKSQKIKLTAEPRHIYPRSYVVAKPASGCIVVAHAWVDAEKHLKEWEREHAGYKTIHCFDKSLVTGSWCTTAYVCAGTSQQNIAIPVVP